jgi:hypothetical protein
MSGFIGTRQVVSQFGLIWREFGPRCAGRCIGAILKGRPTTFLDVAFDTAARGKRTGAARARLDHPSAASGTGGGPAPPGARST